MLGFSLFLLSRLMENVLFFHHQRTRECSVYHTPGFCLILLLTTIRCGWVGGWYLGVTEG